MRSCICDECGMEFTVERLTEEQDTLKGHPVKVLSFICPKCDNKYIVSVMDDESAQLRKEWKAAQGEYRDQDSRSARNEADFRKKKMFVYMNKLKKQYLKELRKRGY